MYFDVTVIVFMVLTKSMHMGSVPLNYTYNPIEFDEHFGFLSTRGTNPNPFSLGKQQSKPNHRPTAPPAPPAKPYIYDPTKKDDDQVPSIGVNTHGGMQGISISQNHSTSSGIFMFNSSQNVLNVDQPKNAPSSSKRP